MQRAIAARFGIGIDGLVRLGLLTVTIAAFLPVLWNGFVNWDDTRSLIDNPQYRGFGSAQLRWMVTESHYGHYVPLAWLTLAADYVVWGMNPAGYHLTSLLIHVAATLTLYAVSRLLITRAAPVAGTAATTVRPPRPSSSRSIPCASSPSRGRRSGGMSSRACASC